MAATGDFSDTGICLESMTKAVKCSVNSENVDSVKFEVRPASDVPIGFIGEHVRIKVNFIADGKDQEVQYFGKMIPTKNQMHREYSEKTRAFYKEIELYKTLFKDMKNAVSPTTRQWRPSCYYTRDWDLMIIEDLSLQNFYMFPEQTLMELEYMRVTVKAMARMHAASFIFEEKLNTGGCTTLSKQPIKNVGKIRIKDLYSNLIYESECTDEPGHPGYRFWEVGIRSQLALIDLLPNYTPEERVKIKERFPDTVRRVYKMLKPSEKYRNIMIHADLWGNNILFKNGSDGKVDEAILVDFQMVRYAPPAQDLFMFLYVSQDDKFRIEHEKELIDLYYESLKMELENEGVNIDDVLPINEFNESCVYYREYAILNQLIYIQFTALSPDVCAKFLAVPELYKKIHYEDRTEMMVENFHDNEFARGRTIEAFGNVIETFKLNK